MTRSLQPGCEGGGACASVMGDSGEEVTREDLSNAYCSLAEVYLTDSWYVCNVCVCVCWVGGGGGGGCICVFVCVCV